ncbi:MAG: galactokinase [Verrucomicrobia bacterium]|nr:galactokinase [Verrucomicrobiota bacterium]
MIPAHQRQDAIAQVFQKRFGKLPQFWCRAPGRVDLMGSHTDYNLGAVLTLPIGRDTWIAARANHTRTVNLHSLNLNADASFSLDSSNKNADQSWIDYVHGVAEALKEEGMLLEGFDGAIHSTVPLSSGLSSSAALECAAATVFETLGGWNLAPLQKALLCQRAENRYVGVNCGILDQFTSCMGQEGCALILDCRDLSSKAVAIADGISIVICDTKSKRQLAGSEYGERRAQCEEGARLLGASALREVTLAQFAAREHELPAIVAKRCRFILEEHARVYALADALTTGDRAAIHILTAASFEGASNLYEIAAPAMHAMMAAMLAAPGVIGARQAGAGFGGCMVAFVEDPMVDAFAAAVRTHYATAAGIAAEIYQVTAAAGAGMMEEFR